MRRYLPLFTLLIVVASFYLYGLNSVGLLSADEPRYAAVGRAMAQSGDWVTPRLWGSPWFEKPPLLYWLIATATSFGAGPEMSARLPVVLLSLAFLAFFYLLTAREFGRIAAIVATIGLATSEGWIVYSYLGLTDLPLACFFGLAVLLLLPLLRAGVREVRIRLVLGGACLGLAVLAKGLVPLVLILPAFWFLRRCWREWWLVAASCLLVALPWYWLMYQRNGYPFIEEFFLKHHLERLYSKSLEHVQPWYYFVPILLALLFPWTPLFLWLKSRVQWDQRRRFLLASVAFGFVFFSTSLNKLPHYLLPLTPLLFVLLGSVFEGQTQLAIRKRWLIPSAILSALIPVAAQALPSVLSAGRISALEFSHFSATRLFYVLAPLAVVLVARKQWAAPLLVLCIVCGGFFVKITAFPVLEEKVSARTFWNREIRPIANDVCEEWIKRDWVYGLSFYRGELIPACYQHSAKWHLLPKPRVWPEIVQR